VQVVVGNILVKGFISFECWLFELPSVKTDGNELAASGFGCLKPTAVRLINEMNLKRANSLQFELPSVETNGNELAGSKYGCLRPTVIKLIK